MIYRDRLNSTNAEIKDFIFLYQEILEHDYTCEE